MPASPGTLLALTTAMLPLFAAQTLYCHTWFAWPDWLVAAISFVAGWIAASMLAFLPFAASDASEHCLRRALPWCFVAGLLFVWTADVLRPVSPCLTP